MPRREKPIEGAGPVALFALELRALKYKTGLTYRDLSIKAHVSQSALSRAASGQKLPSWEITRAYVDGCGGDVSAWWTRWESVHVGAPHD